MQLRYYFIFNYSVTYATFHRKSQNKQSYSVGCITK